jgi:hypothetical protein
MDKAAREAMMPDYEMYCADLAEGKLVSVWHSLYA